MQFTKIHGYVQSFKVFIIINFFFIYIFVIIIFVYIFVIIILILKFRPSFQLILFTEMQLKSLNKKNSEFRILEVDATGNLIKIPKYMAKYNKILKYVMLVKNLSDLSQPGVNTTEMATSTHLIKRTIIQSSNFTFAKDATIGFFSCFCELKKTFKYEQG